MMAMNIELFQQYAAGQQPVLVEFWAPWCVYCRRIETAFDKISQEYAGKLLTAKVNIDEQPLLAHQEQIEVIPTFILYQGGKAVGSMIGPESKSKIQELITETLKA